MEGYLERGHTGIHGNTRFKMAAMLGLFNACHSNIQYHVSTTLLNNCKFAR